MADVNYLNSNNAYRALAIIYENSDENNPVEKQQLMERLEANEHTFTSVMNDIEEAGIIEKEREKPGGKVRYYLSFEDFYEWWKQELIESAEEEYESHGRNRQGLEMLGAIDWLDVGDTRIKRFFFKWIETYFNYIEESTIRKMCFQDIHYGISWEAKDFEYRILTSDDMSWLRTLLAPRSRQEFRKLRKTWYGPGND